ncbi:histone-lysine N-methyltransferase 2C [Cryptotermes secundus]|uniref:histone-lysine N-methyltransferase 2C n=1 Tax=Cryptotermes secundus TaxID=105785 RepID=UPI001454CC39|nr:histone-lysine N-methyltransferase 2C [Cryptotermes secundus]
MEDGQDTGTCLKEGSPGELEIDEEMEMDEGSGGEEEEEEVGDPGSSPSPEQQSTLVHGSSEQAGTTDAAFPLSQDDGSTALHKHSHFSGKPLSLRRGPGRPRKDRLSSKSSRKSAGLKLRRWKSSVYVHGITKSPSLLKEESRDASNPVLEDVEPSPESPSPVRSVDELGAASASCVDPETGHSECSATAAASKTEKMMAPEEPPYFQEQWPGKVCALCNLGERSQLGQGDLMRFSCPEGFTPHKSSPASADRSDAVEMMSPSSETYAGDAVDRESVGSGGDKSPRGGGVSAVTGRRQKCMAKSRNPSLGSSAEQLDELSVVGYPEEPEVGSLFESSGHFYVHQSCALWSSGVTRTEDLVMENVGPAVLEASKRRCSYCSHFGATITCIVTTCTRVLHFPCAAASGAFQDCKTVTMVCSQHLDQVPLLLSGEVTCMTCFALGDVSNLMMCTNCGHHYHGSCVGLALLPGNMLNCDLLMCMQQNLERLRAGWQCPDCRVCQVCRQPEDDSKVMLCEKCDKAYHAQCLRPIVTTIPKIGWKCKCCRVCSDCGSRTPGAGLSSRWHAHYTVCDSCYQQRNKGFSCPLCRRAYRAAAYREMVQCGRCRKFVHGMCDGDADLTTYNRKKESNPDYEYVCPICKPRTQPGREMLPKRKDSTEDGGLESSLTGSQESLYVAEDSGMEVEYSSSDKYSDEGPMRAIGLGKGKPFCAKKKLGFSSISGRGKVISGYQKRQRVTDFGRKRAPKAKMRGIFGVPGLGLQRPQADSSFNKSEEEPGVENRLVLCSAKDKFVLTQDICVMCGAIGIDQEGCLIACAQCGQCYHPYCVNVKVTKVILQKGWRCLDCTVCEGCGQRNDEGRLILCDDCDISFHIYCMDPPLDYVPHGNWKCKWCAICMSCGSNDPGFNCMWQKSFTECGPCASHTTCPSCSEPYSEGDLIIQCVQCERFVLLHIHRDPLPYTLCFTYEYKSASLSEFYYGKTRWLHCSCDQIRTEAEAERCAEDGYNCVLCRPRDVPPPHLQPPPPPPKPPTPTKSPGKQAGRDSETEHNIWKLL